MRRWHPFRNDSSYFIHRAVMHHVNQRPALLILSGIITGILAGTRCNGMDLLIYWVPAIVSIVMLPMLRFRGRIWFCIFLMCIGLGLIRIQSIVPGPSHDHQIRHYEGSGRYTITGKVDSTPHIRRHSTVFILQSETIRSESIASTQVSGKLRVSYYGVPLQIDTGDSVSIESSIRPFRNFYNPGGFDYEKFMHQKEIWGSAYVRSGQLLVLNRGTPSIIQQAQKRIETMVDRWITNGPAAGVMKALLTGNRDGITPDLRDRFNRTGTGHLLAISGLHIGIVGSVVFFILGKFLSYSDTLLWCAGVKKTAGLFSVIPVIGYGILSGMSPSTQRAVIMVVILLISYALEGEFDVVNSLAVAAIIILVMAPESVYSVSFQLSFSAVLFICLGMTQHSKTEVARVESSRIPKIRKYVLSYLRVSLFAFLGTLPLVACYFNQVSLIGVIANCIVVPLIGMIVVPFALTGAFLIPIHDISAGVCIRLSGYALDTALSIIEWLAEIPAASIMTITPSVLEIVCYYAVLTAIVWFIRHPHSRSGTEYRVLRAVLFLSLFILVMDTGYWVARRFFKSDLTVTVMDVGQGTASLIEFPGGACMLIDGGGFSDNSSFDIGAKVIAPMLWGKKIATIETVVVSHPESDHLNGLLYILETFHVREVWSNGMGVETKGYQEFADIVQKRGLNHRIMGGDGIREHVNGVALDILWPLNTGGSVEPSGEMNNHSLVVRAEYHSVSVLFPGDIMEKAELALVETAGDRLKSTLLLAPHHGSNTSSTEGFLDAVQPEFVVISSGWKNRFRMPHVPVLKRLQRMGCRVYRTDRDGAVTINVRNGALHITTVRGSTG